jgi:hypothetical protein
MSRENVEFLRQGHEALQRGVPVAQELEAAERG